MKTQFFEDPSFMVGDVRVDEQRHLMFASAQQLQLLQRARKWYLDKTFKVTLYYFISDFSLLDMVDFKVLCVLVLLWDMNG